MYNYTKPKKMKGYNDIEKQVNRMLSRMLDIYGYDYDNPTMPSYNPTAAARLNYIRETQRRYTFNINCAEGFCDGWTWSEAQAKDYGAIYHIFNSASKKYPREIYAK